MLKYRDKNVFHATEQRRGCATLLVSRIPGPVRVRNAAAWGIAGVRHDELWRAGSGVVARPHENRLKPGTVRGVVPLTRGD